MYRYCLIKWDVEPRWVYLYACDLDTWFMGIILLVVHNPLSVGIGISLKGSCSNLYYGQVMAQDIQHLGVIFMARTISQSIQGLFIRGVLSFSHLRSFTCSFLFSIKFI